MIEKAKFQSQMLTVFLNQVSSSLKSFIYILNHHYFIMNYQLLLSHDNQKHSHNLDHRYNYSSLSRYIQQKPYNSPKESYFSFQSPMPIKLVNYKPQSRTLPNQSYSDDKPHKIRFRIKQKKVLCLPSIDKREQKIKVIRRSFQPSNYKLYKKRVRTQSSHHEDSQQKIHKTSQTNIRILKQKQSRDQKYIPIYSQQNQRAKEEKKDWNRYNHRSRQRQFEQYVHQIQNKFRHSQSRRSVPQQAQIQQKLKNRIQTKKYLYCKPFNPEIHQHQKEIQHTSLSYSKLTKNTIKQQIQEDPQIDQQTAMNLEDEDRQRQRKKNAINDDFIKILRKAKNRGASLLIKLKKYPSKKIEAT